MKLYVVRKYVQANTAEEALKRERTIKPDGIWIEDEWLKANVDILIKKDRRKGKMGFS